MSRLARLSRRVPAVAKAAAVIGGAWGAALAVPSLYVKLAIFLAARGGAPFHGPASAVTRDLIDQSGGMLQMSLGALAFTLSVLVPVALLTRMVARARVRAGLPDPLDRARAFAAAHPRAVRALTAIPALAALAFTPDLTFWLSHWGGYFQYGHLAGTEPILHLRSLYTAWMGGFGVAMATAAAGVYAATRPAVQALLAPTVDIRHAEAEEATGPTSERRIGFDAVAVTPETRAAVALMAALPVATFFAMNAANLGETSSALVLAAYVATALGGAVAFRRASRVAVGVDGIFVTGSSRSRFFAFRDVDTVTAKGSDIALHRKGKVVLRLQLHGEDAAQRDVIVARVAEAIEAAKQRRTAAVGDIVAAASGERLERLARGGEGYRQASVTPAQLWSVVHAPEPDAAVRTAAARALVEGGGEAERSRLRVAASQCAQPAVRVALMAVAEEHAAEGDEHDDGDAGQRKRRATGG